ncbi:hypothetical protein Bca52824_035621 [Brassica carinata]|uniref:Uncharacterized protein n=1 Tax=Brassica carinata TaxID=52824 RepID=A0A8X7S2C4_BRACI|nr:hypothetical protein Bca52824_035621 [Brassica carinata]
MGENNRDNEPAARARFKEFKLTHRMVQTAMLEFEVPCPTVSVASDSAEFVAFESDISKLTNFRAAEVSQKMGGNDDTGDDMPGGGAVKRCHPAENRRDSDIRGNTADGNVAGQTSAPNG